MSMPRDVCPEADHSEVEISKVRAKIVTVEAEVLEVKAEIMKVKADPLSQLRPGLEKEKQTMREELVELRKKENILLGMSCTKPSGPLPVAKTIEVAIPALLHYDSTSHAYVTFDGDESFKAAPPECPAARQQPDMEERCSPGLGPEASCAKEAASAADAPAPAPSLLDLPTALLDNIVSRAVQLGAGCPLSLTCNPLSMSNLLHAPAVSLQQQSEDCGQQLTPRLVSALRARKSKLALTLQQEEAQGRGCYDEVLAQVLAKLGSCAAVEACILNIRKAASRDNPNALHCPPGLAHRLVGSFPNLTALSLHGYRVTCSALACLLSHPQLAIQLQQLDLTGTTIPQPQQPGPDQVALANMFRGLQLKQLSLPTFLCADDSDDSDDSGELPPLSLPDLLPLAQHLTQLEVESVYGNMYHWRAFAAILRPLAQLQVLHARMDLFGSDLLECVQSLPQLHTLQLPWLHATEGCIDDLLSATQLTSIQLSSIADLKRPRSDVPCSWQRLEVKRFDYTTAAHLPLHSLTQPLEADVVFIAARAASSPQVADVAHNLAHASKVPVVFKSLKLDLWSDNTSAPAAAPAAATAMAAQKTRQLQQVVASVQVLGGFATDVVEFIGMSAVCADDVARMAPLCRGCSHVDFFQGSLTPSLEFWRQLVQLMPTAQQVSFRFVEGAGSEAMCESVQLMAEQPWARWLDINITRTPSELPACWQTGNWKRCDNLSAPDSTPVLFGYDLPDRQHGGWFMTGKFKVTIR
ncbi:hypothetical protein QJQ45_003501 [Haematococcus lacustris]|nr:hypothetical protein QJQ45_003501 [Haematococcus lacustris]